MPKAFDLTCGSSDRIARAAKRTFFAATVAVVALHPGDALAQEQLPTAPTIKVQVDRVNVGVIVTDARGRFVENLGKDGFRLLDDGVERPITDFATATEAAQVVLLVESGPAVYMIESGHLRAAATLLNGLSEGDRVAVVGYADRTAAVLDFTADKRMVASALSQVRFNLGSSQLELSASLLRVLDGLESMQGKQTVVLLSTGIDTSPQSAAEKLLARLQNGNVRVLAVALGGELRGEQPKGKNGSQVSADKIAATAEGFAAADAWLRTIAEASGGRAYFPRSAKDFVSVYAQIAQLVRHEYSLAFAPAIHDGKVHRIEVRAGKADAQDNALPPEYRVDSRRAYVAPGAQEAR